MDNKTMAIVAAIAVVAVAAVAAVALGQNGGGDDPGVVTEFTLNGIKYNCRDPVTHNRDVVISGTEGASTGALNLSSSVIYKGATFQVKGIASSAFEGCNGYTGKLTIPEGITFIEDAAFRNCNGFTELALPSTLKYLGATSAGTIIGTMGTFAGCTGLTGTIAIPAGVLSVGNYVFKDCSKIAGATLPKSVTLAGDGVFDGCAALATADIGNCTTVGKYMFRGCVSLTTVDLSAVLQISDYAFQGCTLFKGNSEGNLVIPVAESIGTHAFDGCTGFRLISLLGCRIGISAFKNCTGIEGIALTDVNRIEGGAFQGCKNLSVMIIKKLLTSNDPVLGNLCFDFNTESPAKTYTLKTNYNPSFVTAKSHGTMTVINVTGL